MLYFADQPSRTLFDDVTLTAAYTGNQKTFETGGFSKLTLDVGYTFGATESANTLDFKLEHSTDKVTWYSLVIDETATVSEITPRVWRMGEENLSVIVDIAYKYMRMSLLEAGVVTNFGTATVVSTLSGQ